MTFMKSIILLFVAALTLTVAGCTRGTSGAPDQGRTSTQDQLAEEYYTCPMHPSVRSDKPGACPICGMALVKRRDEPERTAAELSSLREVSLSPSQRVMANVATEPVRRMNLVHAIRSVGVIDEAEPLQAKVAARFHGRIEKLYANSFGVAVKKGQPLFDLYSPDLVTASREYVLALQAQEGAGEGTSGAQNAGMAAASRERLLVHFGMTARQIERLAESREGNSTVTFFSPISGTVVVKDVQEGQYVDEGMVLYQVADLSRVWAYLDVYERDQRFVAPGQTVVLAADAFPGEEFRGRVSFVDPVLTPQSRTVRIRVELGNAGGKLKPQMYVRGTIEVPVGNSLVVPETAILATGSRDVAWVEVKPNVFEPRDVVVGVRDDGGAQILTGLHEGEMVATSGGFLLDSESQLQHPGGRTEPGAARPVTPTLLKEKPTAAPGFRKIFIDVNGGFVPDTVRVKKGETVLLEFHREKESGCIEEVVFPGLKIRKPLAVERTTAFKISPQKMGEIPFECGMGMVRGIVVVE